MKKKSTYITFLSTVFITNIYVNILLWDIYITTTKFDVGFRVVSLFCGLEIPGPDPKLFTDFDCMGFTQLQTWW